MRSRIESEDGAKPDYLFLSDPGHRVIDRYGILNDGSDRGIPHPTTFLITRDGVVRSPSLSQPPPRHGQEPAIALFHRPLELLLHEGADVVVEVAVTPPVAGVVLGVLELTVAGGLEQDQSAGRVVGRVIDGRQAKGGAGLEVAAVLPDERARHGLLGLHGGDPPGRSLLHDTGVVDHVVRGEHEHLADGQLPQ